MTTFTCSATLLALVVAAGPAMAQTQDGNAAMTCADFMALDAQTQGTVLMQVEAGSSDASGTPGADPGTTPETTIGGGAGTDGSPGTQSGAKPDATDGGTGTGAAPQQAPAAGDTGAAGDSAGAHVMAMPALLDGVTANCRADQTLTVAAAVAQAKAGTGTAN